MRVLFCFLFLPGMLYAHSKMLPEFRLAPDIEITQEWTLSTEDVSCANLLTKGLNSGRFEPPIHLVPDNFRNQDCKLGMIFPVSDTVPPFTPNITKERRLNDAKKAKPDKGKIQPVNNTEGNAAIELTKMNVLYIGIDNPVRIAVAGVTADKLQVELIGDGTITGRDGEYIVSVKKPGDVQIKVLHKDGGGLRVVTERSYRVKHIPFPTPKLDGKFESSNISGLIMQQSKGIFVYLGDTDLDASCEVIAFEAVYVGLGQDPISYANKGGEWNDSMQYMFKKAKAGDVYFFENILIKCPGDISQRNIGSLIFRITE